jgi:hypothetical protein
MSCNTNLNTVPRKLQCGICHRCLHYPNPMRPTTCASTSAQLKMLHPTLGWSCPICTLSIVKLVAHTYHNNNRHVLPLPYTQLANADVEMGMHTPATNLTLEYLHEAPPPTSTYYNSPDPTTATTARTTLTEYLDKLIRCNMDQAIDSHPSPPPLRNNDYTLAVGNNTPPLLFEELDWGTTFRAFAQCIPNSIRNRLVLTETNKCFIIHLAMAANLSPIRLWAQLKKHVLHRTSHPLLRADLVECLTDIMANNTQLTDQLLECTTSTPLSTYTIVIIATGHGQHHTHNDLQAVNVYPPTTTAQSARTSSIFLHHNTLIGHYTVLQPPAALLTDNTPLQATHLIHRLRQAGIDCYVHPYDRETALQEFPY